MLILPGLGPRPGCADPTLTPTADADRGEQRRPGTARICISGPCDRSDTQSWRKRFMPVATSDALPSALFPLGRWHRRGVENAD